MRWDRRALGAAAVACAVLAGAANLWLPWISVPVAGQAAHLVYRAELLNKGGILYEQELLWIPLAAAALALAAGAVLCLPARWAAGPLGSRLPMLALEGMAVAGVGLLLCGARWLGFFVARLLDSGPTLVHLHAVPYVDLSAGALLVVGALAALDPPWLRAGAGPARRVAAAAATSLVGLPLLPLAAKWPEGFHYDELTVDLARAIGAPGARAAVAVATLRWALGLLLALACVAGLLRDRPAVRWGLRAATALGGVAAVACAAFFYANASAFASGAVPWYNPALPLAGPALLGLALWPSAWNGAGKGGRRSLKW